VSDELLVTRLHPAASLPARAHPGDAGLDLTTVQDVSLKPGERALVPTGLAVAIPNGYAGLVVPRSGLAVRLGLGLVNAPGLIDAGYRGEVKVLLVNLDPDEPIVLRAGERIAQLVLVPVPAITVREAGELPASARGDGGFGSTGR